ncbi:serine hydrolase domain-containing protein, partial [Levilinea saccharolytica]
SVLPTLTTLPPPAVSPTHTPNPTPSPYPLDWPESAPEDQGMDSNLLEAMGAAVPNQYPHIRSLLVFRHDTIVYERYYKGLTADSLHEVASITKSITSALIGIALHRGDLQSLEQPIAPFFPEEAAAADPRFQRITLRHLLELTAGFEWEDTRLWMWSNDPNPTRYTFQLPIVTEPGEKFNYNTPAVHLLSAVLTRATGLTEQEYADQHLFGPLGITQYQWPKDPQGYSMGGNSLSLRTRDLARFGSLYLHQGSWHGQQLVPADWVNLSTQVHTPGGYPENLPYGYLWWVEPDTVPPAYFAAGFGGQFIYIIPSLDLVAVLTSNTDSPHMENRQLIADYVLPAVLPAP